MIIIGHKMCRFIAYLGKPIIMDEILLKTNNSLIEQSIMAREKVKETTNGDGFGIGWYNHDISDEPAVFRSIQPAWNDQNLLNIVPKIRSNGFFAHVRAASIGPVSKLNCHPFHHERFLFMHNGIVKNFHMIRREIIQRLSNKAFNWIQGQTDSEHICALFLNRFFDTSGNYTVEDVAKILRDTIHEIQELQTEHPSKETTLINVVITDGRNAVAVRYTSNPKESNTLYFSERNGDGTVSDGQNKKNTAVLIVSEKLTEYPTHWQEVPINHILLVNSDLQTTLEVL